jgi:hypothetical protein
MERFAKTKTKLAEIISILLNPVLMVILMLFALSFANPISFLRLLFIMLPFFTATAGYVGVRAYILKDSDLDLSKLKSRRYLGLTSFGGVIVSSIFCYFLYPTLLPLFVYIGVIILFAGIISLFWKISFHAIGYSAMCVSFFRLFGAISLPLVLLVPVLFWARLRLKKHTIWQLIAGSLLGLVFLI